MFGDKDAIQASLDEMHRRAFTSGSPRLPDGYVFECPQCKGPMSPIKGFCVVWCWVCDRTVDLWYETPPVISASVITREPQDECPKQYDTWTLKPTFWQRIRNWIGW